MKKFIIKNRKDQNIVVLFEKQEKQRGLVFVMHGLGGFKEQPHIEAFAQAFKEKGYSAVRFDATNSFGESGGDYQDASVTNHLQDLEEIIDWAKNQQWYQEPFCLIGHSLGAIAISLYTENHPEKVKGLVPVSTLISGKLWLERHDKDLIEKWREEGTWNRGESFSKPGAIKILKWNFVEDIMRYDLLENVQNLNMPVLLMVGDLDTGTPLINHQILFDVLPGTKELHVIKGADHNFKEAHHLEEIKATIKHWIEKNNL
jgi:putative redox protein